MNIDRYNSIAKNIGDFQLNDIKPYIPELSQNDYKKGYFVRYFVQLYANPETPIFEISKISISKYRSNPFYKTVSLDWRLTGSIEDIKKSNRASVLIAAETLPNIQLYLPNFLQFYLDN